MRPFFKWAGGKYRLVERIQRKLPPGKRLLEPFAGSCALSINTDYEAYWLNDINPDLTSVYQILQREGLSFISSCKHYFTSETNTSAKYYEIRERFNQEKDRYTKAMLFIYLNRHGYNGLCRYNSSGEFNVPFGRYRKPYFPEKELGYFYEKFQKALFSSLDFETMMMKAKAGDVIYCDPPYIPLNATSNFTAYSTGGFGEEDQIRLAKVARKLAKKGIQTVISNHYNDFIVKAYSGAQIEIFPVKRFISCDGDNRNSVDEVLAVFS
ncbi:MAG TPA: DNA adenine methylase [Firmicutes bacterium]|nr:DNA adenine methylase [Bacillota bacterium]